MYGFMIPNMSLGRIQGLEPKDIFTFIGVMMVALLIFIILYRIICSIRDIKVTNQKLRMLTILAMSISILSYITLKVNQNEKPQKETKIQIQNIQKEEIKTPTKNPNIKIEMH